MQQAVLMLAAQGNSSAQIAANLNVSLNTAETQLRRVYLKMRVHRREEAVFLGQLSGLIRIQAKTVEVRDESAQPRLTELPRPTMI